MSITTHDLGTGISYLDANQLPALLGQEEDNVAIPYADSLGIATIGIGVNLRVSKYMALVLDQLDVFSN